MTPHSVKGSRKQNKPKKAKKPATSQKVDINFPLGRPTADAIESLCQNQRLRPLYSVKCLPGSDYDWLIRQAKTINRIEKGFKQCCKKKQGVLECADQKVKYNVQINILAKFSRLCVFHVPHSIVLVA